MKRRSCAATFGIGGAKPGRARSNDLAGRSTALAPPCLLLGFASVIVWTENKSPYLTADRFICFYFHSETIPAALCVLRATTKKVVNFLRWPGSRMFWPRNDLAPFLRWRRHCVLGGFVVYVNWRFFCWWSWRAIKVFRCRIYRAAPRSVSSWLTLPLTEQPGRWRTNSPGTCCLSLSSSLFIRLVQANTQHRNERFDFVRFCAAWSK